MPLATNSLPLLASAVKSGLRSALQGVIRAGITPENTLVSIVFSKLRSDNIINRWQLWITVLLIKLHEVIQALLFSPCSSTKVTYDIPDLYRIHSRFYANAGRFANRVNQSASAYLGQENRADGFVACTTFSRYVHADSSGPSRL